MKNISTEKIKEKVRKSIFYKIFRIIETSAMLGLVVSIAFFVYEMNESRFDGK